MIMSVEAEDVPLVSDCVIEELGLPAPLEVRCSSVAGRGLYAREGIPRGTQLFTALPLAHVANGQSLMVVCQNCLGTQQLVEFYNMPQKVSSPSFLSFSEVC